MAMFELIAVDGVTVDRSERAESSAICRPSSGEMELGERLLTDMQELRNGMAQMMSAILTQQGEIAKLNRALSLVRVSRTQELALCEAIRARARELRRTEAMPESAERRIAGAIRSTIREATGARAIGDIQAAQFESTMTLIGSWYMKGALRRIRRETEGKA